MEFTALIRQAAANDPNYQAMLIATRLARANAKRGEGEELDSVVPDTIGPIVEGRLIKLASKYKQRVRMYDKLGLRYTATPDGLLYLSSNAARRLVIPRNERVRTLLLAYLHDHDGHHGRDKVVASAQLRVWWQGMDADIRRYVASCPKCMQIRAPPGKEQGMAMPLEAPQYPWQWVTMDFVGPLPTSRNGYDTIVVFVDRFTKMKHFAACKSTITAEQTVQLFEQHVVRLHGWPEYLTTDRGAVFTSKYWRNYFQRVGVKLRMTTAYHPQTDGQSERDIKTLLKVLTAYVNARRDDWDLHLPMVEFAINSVPSVATGKSPFKVNYGVEANKPIDIALANLKATLPPNRSLAATLCTVRQETHPSTESQLGSSPSVSGASHSYGQPPSGEDEPDSPQGANSPAPPDNIDQSTRTRATTARLRAPPREANKGLSPLGRLAPPLSSAASESSLRLPASLVVPDDEDHVATSVTDSMAPRQAARTLPPPVVSIDDSNPAVDARLAELQRIVLETRLALSRHQESIAAAIAKHRRAVNYTVGEQVLLSTQHLVLPTDSASPSTKLRPNYVGPYTITRVISPNVVELQLNPQDSFHPIVNVSRLKPYQPTPPAFQDRPQPALRPPPAISGEGQEAEWTVEAIVGHRFNQRRKRHEFCVKWLGYDESESTWEPIEHLYDNQYFLQFITVRPYPTAVYQLVDELTSRTNSQSVLASPPRNN